MRNEEANTQPASEPDYTVPTDEHDERSYYQRKLDLGGTFKDDASYHKTPGLLLTYMKGAVEHLRAIDECLILLAGFSNLNLMDAQNALIEERTKLVSDRRAYAEAQTILDSLGLSVNTRISSLDE